MTTLFTKIIDGELPGRFVWRDETAVVFMTINPVQRGHALVVPRAEVDNWLDLDADVARHLMDVARRVGRAQQRAFDRERVALVIAGLEVPHVHLHTIPIISEADMRFENADPNPDPADLDAAAADLRDALRSLGASEVVQA